MAWFLLNYRRSPAKSTLFYNSIGLNTRIKNENCYSPSLVCRVFRDLCCTRRVFSHFVFNLLVQVRSFLPHVAAARTAAPGYLRFDERTVQPGNELHLDPSRADSLAFVMIAAVAEAFL